MKNKAKLEKEGTNRERINKEYMGTGEPSGKIKIIGTGHILERSVDEVQRTIEKERPDIVAVELDRIRFQELKNQNVWKEVSFWDLLIKSVGGGSFRVFVGGIMRKIQQDMGKKFGVAPGSDLMAAVNSAQEVGSKVALIDRDIDITLNHLLAIPLREKLGLVKTDKEMAELLQLDKILEEETIKKLMDYLKKNFPALYSAMVGERDLYMAYNLQRLRKENPEKDILAVVGAGHKQGINYWLKKWEEDGTLGVDIKLQQILSKAQVGFFQWLSFFFIMIFAYIFMKINISRMD